MKLEYQVSHKSNSKESSGIIKEEHEIVLPAEVAGKRNPVRVELLDLLEGKQNATSVQLNYLLPKFLKVTNRATAKPITILMEPYPGT